MTKTKEGLDALLEELENERIVVPSDRNISEQTGEEPSHFVCNNCGAPIYLSDVGKGKENEENDCTQCPCYYVCYNCSSTLCVNDEGDDFDD